MEYIRGGCLGRNEIYMMQVSVKKDDEKLVCVCCNL